MQKILRGMLTNMEVVGEVLAFLWARKLGWLLPMVVMLLLFALFVVFGNATGIAPFIYTLF